MKVSEAWQNVVCQMLFVLFCIAILIFFSPASKAWNVWTFLKPFVARFRVRKEEDKVGVRRLAWLYSINQNHKTKVALLARFTKAQLFTITQFPGLLQFSEQSVSTSLNLVSLSLTSITVRGSFIWSLHANYCNQTQVFIILHLTYLLTARLPMLSLLLQTSLNHAPLATPLFMWFSFDGRVSGISMQYCELILPNLHIGHILFSSPKAIF